jgi:hypothetical protein
MSMLSASTPRKKRVRAEMAATPPDQGTELSDLTPCKSDCKLGVTNPGMVVGFGSGARDEGSKTPGLIVGFGGSGAREEGSSTPGLIVAFGSGARKKQEYIEE